MKIQPICVIAFLILGSYYDGAKAEVLKNASQLGVVPHQRRLLPTFRIVGGNEAVPHLYPYQAALFVIGIFNTSLCGGSLISTTDILTAAHCLDGATTVMVYLGSHNLNRLYEDGTTVSFRSSNFVLHNNWNPETLENDIAIIKLAKKVDLNNFIKLVKVDFDTTNTHASEVANLTGWGLTSDVLRIPPTKLRVLKATITSNEVCKSFESFGEIIKKTHLCADAFTLSGSCSGDSGGPLVIGNVQVGIVSFGMKYCETPLPSVYTRVSHFASWIVEHSDIEI